MARNLRTWHMSVKYVILHLLLIQELSVLLVNGFNYDSYMQQKLCDAQCEARCLDKVEHCRQSCDQPNLHWMTNSDRPFSNGTCNNFYNEYKENKASLVHVPDVSINQVNSYAGQLTWRRPGTAHTFGTTVSNHSIIYIIERIHHDPTHHILETDSIVAWLTDTIYQFNITEKCNTDTYRVMAINQFGSRGFSQPARLPDIQPGYVQHIGYVGGGLYYYKNKEVPQQSAFMAILKWDPPTGWDDRDVGAYVWNPMVQRYCRDVGHDSLPMFTRMEHKKRSILMTINDNSIGCYFVAQVRAISICNMTGPWTNFTVDLTDAGFINGYTAELPFNPPGNVENVSLAVSSLTLQDLRRYFLFPKVHMASPLIVYLHVRWNEPSDLGSNGFVDHYIVRSGRVERQPSPLPPTFLDKYPSIKEAPNDTIEMIFDIPTDSIPYTFGIQVIAVGPGQTIQPNQWGMYPIYTMIVSRNDSGLATFPDGDILLDRDGILVFYVNNTLPTHFMFNQPIGRLGNTTIDRYAVQWGPLVGPMQTMSLENSTVIPYNQSVLSVYLQHSAATYGIRVTYLSDDPEDSSGELFYTFNLPDYDPGLKESEPSILSKYYPVMVAAGLLLVLGVVVVAARYHLARHNHFKNLERRLLQVGEEVDEQGEHYFVLRAANTQPEEDPGTVHLVTDHWELPHSCLKTGRVIGSGAFGQVVKGRVSRSLLQHRGIDPRVTQALASTHLTVAVKMLQENSEERYARDFLNEIQMMKELGYHGNIVSLLGCCTLREPYCLVVEHFAHGDLLAYLRKIRQHITQHETVPEGYVNQDVEMFSPQDLLSVCRQIARGMEYLSQKGFVHRDLAARNVLVGENKQVKVGDFGLARYIYDDVQKIYVNRRGGKLPVRWMSPEAIFDMIFSTASDIWAYGIVLYEIVTLGGAPYPSLSNAELLQSLKQGYRMDRPDNCSQEIYEMMLQCWDQAADQRPSFSQLCDVFTSMLEECSQLEYFNFKVVDHRDYYTISTDEMDMDDLDLHCCHGDQGSQLTSEAGIITRLPDENVTVTDLEKTDLLEAAAPYIDSSTPSSMPSVASFHNGLYSVTDEDDCISIATSGGRSRCPSTEERISSSSDDVFSDCQACAKVSSAPSNQDDDDDDDSLIRVCKACGRINLRLRPLDIHVSERIDSAICSTASDDSDHSHGNTSESSSATSDEYLMPDSPCVVMETKLSCSEVSSVTSSGTFVFDDTMIPVSPSASRTVENPDYLSVPDVSFVQSDQKDYYHVVHNHLESMKLRRHISGQESWSLAETVL